MRDTDRTANDAAEFLAASRNDPDLDTDALPAIRVAGVLVFVYVDDGMLRVSVDLDDVGPENTDADVLDLYNVWQVPMVITVQGEPVFRADARRGPPCPCPHSAEVPSAGDVVMVAAGHRTGRCHGISAHPRQEDST